jgi:hypothetical protein
MGENGRLLARTKYDWNTIAKKLSIAYFDITATS